MTGAATSHAPDRLPPVSRRRRVVAGPTWHAVTRPEPDDAPPAWPFGTGIAPPAPAPALPPAAALALPQRAAPARERRRLAVPRRLDRRLAVVVATAAALVAGVGAGAAGSLLGEGSPAQVAAASPEVCAAAQVAWTTSAARQAGMLPEQPETLRTGFVGASLALADVEPPPAIAEDWGAVKSYLDEVAAPLGDVDPGDSETITDVVADALARLDTAAVTAAAARVTAYLKSSCAG